MISQSTLLNLMGKKDFPVSDESVIDNNKLRTQMDLEYSGAQSQANYPRLVSRVADWLWKTTKKLDLENVPRLCFILKDGEQSGHVVMKTKSSQIVILPDGTQTFIGMMHDRTGFYRFYTAAEIVGVLRTKLSGFINPLALDDMLANEIKRLCKN
jgi:hypothetical protein